MKNQISKTLNFIYQDTEIHFLINPLDDNVMVNATEMAKPFKKRVKNFLRLEETKNFINYQVEKNYIGSDVSRYIEENIYYSNNKAGTYMTRKLALKFAMWLDIAFEDWVFETIEKILFANYKKHWDAHVIQTQSENKLEKLKSELHIEPTIEKVKDYFKELDIIKSAKTAKRKAIANQLKMDL